MDGSATFTTVMSSTIISWAQSTTASVMFRRSRWCRDSGRRAGVARAVAADAGDASVEIRAGDDMVPSRNVCVRYGQADGLRHSRGACGEAEIAAVPLTAALSSRNPGQVVSARLLGPVELCSIRRLPPITIRRIPPLCNSKMQESLMGATGPAGQAGPPMRADARRNYDRLLAAAAAAFAEHGADDVSLEEIARRAGVGIGTLYRHFPNRRDLLEAVYLDQVRGL